MIHDIPTSTYNLNNEDLLRQLAFVELQVMGVYFRELTEDVEKTQSLYKSKDGIEGTTKSTTIVLEKIDKEQDTTAETEWGTLPTQPIGKAINALQKYTDHFQSNVAKISIDVNPKDEFVSKQVSSLMFYGSLCSIYNYLKKLPINFSQDETKAMENFSTHLATIKKDLPNFLNQQPQNHLKIQEINAALNHELLYKLPACKSYDILNKYLPYQGNVFDDLAQVESRSNQAFTSGLNACTELTGDRIDPVFWVSSFDKGILVATPIKLYFTYVLRFLNNRLAQPDMKNAKKNKENAILQLSKVTEQPFSIQLEMAKKYLATHQQ